MVAQLAVESALRKALRDKLVAALNEFQPDTSVGCETPKWRERKLPPLNDDFGGTSTEKRELMGANHATLRLGRAMQLRKIDRADYDRLVSRDRPPYLPVLLQACREDQLSYEYRHGVTSYGAFTYSLAKDLRAQPRITFEKIILKTTATLKDLGYDQNPQLVGPKPVTSKTIPGLVAQRRSPRRRRQRR